MIRWTSVKAYYEAIDRGSISKRRWEVFDIVCRHAGEDGLTAMEAYTILQKETGVDLNYDSNTRARFTELREMGLLVELGTKICSQTGATATAWAPSWATTIKKIVKKPSLAEENKRLKRTIWKLIAQIKALKGEDDVEEISHAH